MGQNQDKLDGGEKALVEGSEETCPDSGAAGSQAGDVMEGGSFGEEKAGNTEENSEQPDAEDLDESHSQEPETPSSERHINLWAGPFAARELRQGGAAGKEGGGEEGGKTAPLARQETGKNQESSARTEGEARTYKLFKKKMTEELKTSSTIKMEYEAEGMVQYEENQDENILHEKYGHDVTSGNANCHDTNEDDTVVISRCGAQAARNDLMQRAVSEFLQCVQQDEDENIIVEEENEDIKLCAGTVDYLSERKDPPTGQSQHPLINRLQKESLLDMSDAIHYRAPKERTENNKKEETQPTVNDFSSTKPKVSDTQGKSARAFLQMDTTETDQTDLASDPVLPVEASSILERLLKRNRKEATPALSIVEEVEIDGKNTAEVPVEKNSKRIPYNAAKVTSANKADNAEKGMKRTVSSKEKTTHDPHNKDLVMKQTVPADSMTSDVLRFQPSVNANSMCESSPAKSHCFKTESSAKNITNASVDEEMETIPNIGPCKYLPADNFQSGVSHERASCEVSGVIAGESASAFAPDVKSLPIKSDGHVAGSCHVLTDNKTDISAVTLRKKSESKSKTDEQLNKVKDADGSSALIAANTENKIPDQTDKKTVRNGDDSISEKDKSPTSPKLRPVSGLIKETVELHEKLQHQDRSKPPEVKSDELGHSVRVAQMKAAFDSAQKSPDRAIERKPSVRKGKEFKI